MSSYSTLDGYFGTFISRVFAIWHRRRWWNFVEPKCNLLYFYCHITISMARYIHLKFGPFTVILIYFLPLMPRKWTSKALNEVLQDTRQSKAFLIGNPNIFGTLIKKPNCILYRPIKSSLHKMYTGGQNKFFFLRRNFLQSI